MEDLRDGWKDGILDDWMGGILGRWKGGRMVGWNVLTGLEGIAGLQPVRFCG